MAQESKWDYPVKPGSQEWAQLITQDMKVQACQIPVEILQKISSEDLVALCLSYPLFINTTVFPTFQKGMDDLRNDFNGINELFRRAESSKLLSAKYIKLSVKNLDPNWTILQKGKHAYDLMFLELVLSQKEILKQLSKNELKLLLNNSVQKYNDKKDLLNIYGEISLNTIGLLISSTILQIDSSGELFSLKEIQDMYARMNINSPGINDYIPKIDKVVNDVNRLIK